MGLKPEPPAGMCQTIGDRGFKVGLPLWTIHGLEHEMLEIEAFEHLRGKILLGKDQFELVAVFHAKRGMGFGADANPIDARGSHDRAVGFKGDGEPFAMKGTDRRPIQLEEGFAAGANDKPPRALPLPGGGDGRAQRRRIGKAAAARTIDTDEIRIAKAADGTRPIFLAPRPKIAPGETAKDRGAAGIETLALKRVEDFLDLICHEPVIAYRLRRG